MYFGGLGYYYFDWTYILVLIGNIPELGPAAA